MINLVTLQENLENLSQNFSKQMFIFDLLSVYELPKSTISLLSKNPTKLSGKEDQIILKNKLLFHTTTLEEDEHVAIDALQKDKTSYKFNPRFIIVTDFVTFLAVDTKTKETLDIQIGDLGKHYAFFLPWCGMEKSQHVNENPADIRAAYKMDKLYQAIITDDPEYYKNNSHDLNIFLSRLLFCFFAEDTGIFPKTGMFTNSVNSHTHENGDEMDTYFSTLFDVLDTKDSDRSKFASHFLEFPYVNGGLFETNIKLPTFTATSRKLIIECGKLNWDSINPDIFGSMIQAVVLPGQRENLGMHYTSVPNIMKVIEPLFLNDLYEELENSKTDIKKLTKLRERVAKIKIFDPACGSGNFLIISYKELSKLESKIISYAKDLGHQMMSYSGVSLNSFYGIEIDDFAHEIARLSLWLAQHQMNQYFDGMFGIMKATLPLKESGKIACGNAVRVDWNEVCPRKDQVVGEHEIYVVGNPPYLGSRNQEDEQKEDLKSLFINDYKSLDYISAWFYKGAKYISGHEKIKLAFVSTNSISQGEQVALLWPLIFQENVEICFAHQSFKWKNLAKGNAGVTCVIIGLANQGGQIKKLYSSDQYRNVKNINPYLTEGNSSFITRRSSPLSKDLPQMTYGNLLNDGGNFVLTKEEKDQLIEKYPESNVLVKSYIGSQEFIRGQQRWCLYIKDDQITLAKSIPEIVSRLNKIRILRSASTEKSTRAMADFPHKYYFLAHKETSSIIIPRTSSENRDYIPMGFLDNKTIISDAAQVIYNAEPYIFAILNSRMHMTWVRAVGGRLKTDLRYSSALCYNTFPFPEISPKQKESLTSHVYNILEEREKCPEKTMADLYDPDKMPDGLREAHKYLDLAIDQIYRSKPFDSDEDRLAHLFKLYEEMITRKTNQ
ncbi:MAG: DNA methyltransferase [Candidatus Paceibacterota bacterium]